MRYYIIAGESSGDLHGANLMRGLLKCDPPCKMRYWGGELMDGAYTGVKGTSALAGHYSGGAVMGFGDVLAKAGTLIGRFSRCTRDILAFGPDVLILIDYPGFNMRVASFAHAHGIPVFYYIAPKVWASREGRIKRLRRDVDMLFPVFPFEREYFKSKGIPYIYEGNPLLDAVDGSPSLSEGRVEFFSRVCIGPCEYVAVLPGSRKDEVRRTLPPVGEFFSLIHKVSGYSDLHIIVAGAPGRDPGEYAPLLGLDPSRIHLLYGETYSILRHSRCAVINSGTASLEACLIGTPQVVTYSTSPLNYLVARGIMTVGQISLGNLILRRDAVKELIQENLSGENLRDEVMRIMEDREYRERMICDYGLIRRELGERGACGRIARAMVRELEHLKGR